MGLSWFSGCLKGLSVFIFNSVRSADEMLSPVVRFLNCERSAFAFYIFRLPENYFCRYGGQECPPYNQAAGFGGLGSPPYGVSLSFRLPETCFSSSFFAF
ncbi:MAG: hypothetical protein IKX14_00220 [Neisseriaceae bacterium]|nr:hypothetical protein [Neisseriaceae bacterium]